MAIPTQQNPLCPECGCKTTVKKGKRRNRLQTLQVFRCTECLHRFTGSPGKNKTYPLRLILETVSTFNLGYSTTETQQILRNSGMQVGSVLFHAAVTDAVGTIVRRVSDDPPKYLVKLLFSFRGVDEVEVPEDRIEAK